MCRATVALLVCAASFSMSPCAFSQQSTSLPPATPTQPSSEIPYKTPAHTLIPMPQPVLSAGVLELLKLEGDFSEAVTKGGGKAFSSWFADDGVTLNNGHPAVLGRTAIAATADWDPKTYQLSWFAEGAQMGPSSDAGFTWGHYDAVNIDKDGKQTKQSGRYITFWKKVDGKWKVALDASANEPIDASALPKPN